MKVKINNLNDSSEKRMVAKFYNERGRLVKTVKFGQRGSRTYPDHKNRKTMLNYLKRHRVNENWSDPYSAGALSRWVLWSDTSIKGGKQNYSHRYRIKLV